MHSVFISGHELGGIYFSIRRNKILGDNVFIRSDRRTLSSYDSGKIQKKFKIENISNEKFLVFFRAKENPNYWTLYQSYPRQGHPYRHTLGSLELRCILDLNLVRVSLIKELRLILTAIMIKFSALFIDLILGSNVIRNSRQGFPDVYSIGLFLVQ